MLIAFLGVTQPLRSFATYDGSVDWSDLSQSEIHPDLDARYSSNENLFDPKISFPAVEIALSDSDSLVPKEFKVPQDLRSAVRFWLRIYTEYTTRHIVIFDSRHPQLVYEVLDFRKTALAARGPIAYEITVRKKVTQTLAAYKNAFHFLAKHPSALRLPDGNAREISLIRKALADTQHKHTFSEMGANLRTQTGQRDNIIRGLVAAEPFFPKMEEIFRKVGVPVELTRLPLVESSFNLNAKSRVGAAGVWQFMRTSGGQYMIIENSDAIDERLSPLKSTVAAAHLLKETFQRFKSWPLTVTAYNHGLRGLTHIKRDPTADFSKIAPLFDACNEDSPLGWAGRNYYAEFLAVLHAETYRKLFYGEAPMQGLRPIQYQALEKASYPVAVAKNMKVSVETFKKLNPDVQNISRRMPKGFMIAGPSKVEDLNGLYKSGRRRRMVARASTSKGIRKRPKQAKT